MALRANTSAITHIEVTFREIDAIYDLPGDAILAKTEDGKVQVLFNHELSTMVRHGIPSFTDMDGNLVSGIKSEVPGVYQGLRVFGYAPFPRTFVRHQSQPLNKNYVYVWVADDKTGTGVSLLHELYFENGQFQYIDFNSQSCKGNDVRPPHGPKRTKLILEALGYFEDRASSGDRKTGVCRSPAYFFLLSPFQVPWQALDTMKANIVDRGIRLYDEFWTDAYLDGDPKNAEPILKIWQRLAEKQSKRIFGPDYIGYQVYLPDPFKEAIRRNRLYVDALERRNKKQADLAGDREYVLAKRVQAFAASSPDLSACVQGKLYGYFEEKESESRRHFLATMMRVADLLRWIGKGQRRDKVGPVDTWYSDGKKRYKFTEDKGENKWHNLFSQACRDYHRAPDKTFFATINIIDVLMERLAETQEGQDWLEEILKRYLGEKNIEDPADGGAAALFQSVRKGYNLALEGAGRALKHFGPTWTKVYQEQALSSVKYWYKTKHGIEFDERQPRAVRRAVQAQARRQARRESRRARRELQQARKMTVDELKHLGIDSTKVKAGEMTEYGLKRLFVGLELYNLSVSVDAVRKNVDDPWQWANLVGSACDAWSAFAEASSAAKAITPELKYTVGSKVLRYSPIAVASSTIDTVLSIKDLVDSNNAGARLGNSLKTIGCAMTVFGAAAAETGVGVIVGLIGLGLQAGSNWVVSNFSDAAVFLRHCRWGTGPSSMDSAAEAFSQQDGYWFKGKLSELAKDVEAQHRCLDNLIFNYKPKLSWDKGEGIIIGGSLILKMEATTTEDKTFTNLLGPNAEWEIKVAIRRPDFGTVSQFNFAPDEYFDYVDVSGGEPISIKSFAKTDASKEPYSERAKGKIIASGTARLDVHGDGRHLVERPIDEESFHLTWFDP